MLNQTFKNCIGIALFGVGLMSIEAAAQLEPLEPEQTQSTQETLENLTVNPVVSFEVDRSGKPINVTIVESSGDEQLDAIALSLVQQWQFDPDSAQPLQTYTATINLDLDQRLSDNKYPAVVVDSFMEGCTKGEVEYEPFCSCTIENIEQKVPLEDFMAISIAIEENPEGEAAQQFEPILTDAFISCLDQAPEDFFESQ